MEMGAGRVKNYKDLIVWQKAIELVIEIYDATSRFPREEIYGLTSQLRRAAVSVPSNIAEGQGRATKGEFIQFLCHARGSLCESDTQIPIARRLGYLAPELEEHLTSLSNEVGRILNGLLTSLGGPRRKLSTTH
jgi:four helix bundle protein